MNTRPIAGRIPPGGPTAPVQVWRILPSLAWTRVTRPVLPAIQTSVPSVFNA